jgi:hypothetical protein
MLAVRFIASYHLQRQMWLQSSLRSFAARCSELLTASWVASYSSLPLQPLLALPKMLRTSNATDASAASVTQ